MATGKQEKALEEMVENGGIASKAMLEAGYSPNTAKTPQKLTESLGFIELCEEKGLTDNFLINALIEDIKKKKGNRRAELELGFKIKGRLVQKTDIVSGNKCMQIVFDESFSEKCDKENPVIAFGKEAEENLDFYK
jgi:hypothetical protein